MHTINLDQCECTQCDRQFETPSLPDISYGEFLLVSKHAEVRYLNTIANPVFEAFEQLLFSLAPSSIANANWIELFAIATADLDSLGAPFQVQTTVCPYCFSSTHVKTVTSNIASKCIEPLSHITWSSLNLKQKQQKISALLAS